MKFSFKEYSQFVDESAGITDKVQLDEIWDRIFKQKKANGERVQNSNQRTTGDEDEDDEQEPPGASNKVKSAKEATPQKPEDPAARRRRELNARRDAEWAKAKDRVENRGAHAKSSLNHGSSRAAETDWHDNISRR